MTRLARVELFKLRTTRLAFYLFLAAVALTLLSVVLTLVFSDQIPGEPVESAVGLRSLLSQSSSVITFVLVLGIISMSGEYRQGTITPTLLAVPLRWRVVAAKGLAFAVVGALFAVAGAVVAGAVVFPYLQVRGFEVAMSAGDIAALFGGTIASGTIAGIFGVGAGALIPNQVAALASVLLEQMVAEPILLAIFPDYLKYLPAGSGRILSGGVGLGELSLPLAALIYLGWALLLVVGGILVTERKDVT